MRNWKEELPLPLKRSLQKGPVPAHPWVFQKVLDSKELPSPLQSSIGLCPPICDPMQQPVIKQRCLPRFPGGEKA